MSPNSGATASIRAAAGGDPQASLVVVGNFEVEEHWSRGEPGLPRLSSAAGTALVNRMDELAFLLSGKGDHVLLKTRPDADWVAYLEGLGLDLPQVLTPAEQSPDRTVTEDALRDAGVLAALGELAAEGSVLLPHGVSDDEERLASVTGLRLGAPGAGICKRVNTKIYSRRIATELGLRQSRGWDCETLDELTEAVSKARAILVQGGRVCLKEALGVSGKGIAVVDDLARLDRLHRMMASRAAKTGTDVVNLVVEEWVDKTTDLNYQFTVDRAGLVRFDFVKEAITQEGVHKGHRMPARLTPKQYATVQESAQLLGRRLAQDGYFGVVGVDAMVQPDGGVLPVVEINARNNMSTYQMRLTAECVPDTYLAVARHFPMRLTREVGFAEIQERLGSLLYDTGTATGLLVNNVATVNAGAQVARTFEGRLYGLLVAATDEELESVDRQIEALLADLVQDPDDHTFRTSRRQP